MMKSLRLVENCIRQCGTYFELTCSVQHLKDKIVTEYMSGRADTWLRGTKILHKLQLTSGIEDGTTVWQIS